MGRDAKGEYCANDNWGATQKASTVQKTTVVRRKRRVLCKRQLWCDAKGECGVDCGGGRDAKGEYSRWLWSRSGRAVRRVEAARSVAGSGPRRLGGFAAAVR